MQIERPVRQKRLKRTASISYEKNEDCAKTGRRALFDKRANILPNKAKKREFGANRGRIRRFRGIEHSEKCKRSPKGMIFAILTLGLNSKFFMPQKWKIKREKR